MGNLPAFILRPQLNLGTSVPIAQSTQISLPTTKMRNMQLCQISVKVLCPSVHGIKCYKRYLRVEFKSLSFQWRPSEKLHLGPEDLAISHFLISTQQMDIFEQDASLSCRGIWPLLPLFLRVYFSDLILKWPMKSLEPNSTAHISQHDSCYRASTPLSLQKYWFCLVNFIAISIHLEFQLDSLLAIFIVSRRREDAHNASKHATIYVYKYQASSLSTVK